MRKNIVSPFIRMTKKDIIRIPTNGIISRKTEPPKKYVITDDLYLNNESFYHSIRGHGNHQAFLDSLQKRSIEEYNKAVKLKQPIINMVFFGHWGWAFSEILSQYKKYALGYSIIQSVKPIPGCDVYQYWRGASNDLNEIYNSLGPSNHTHNFIAKGIDMFHDSPNDAKRSKIGIRMKRLRSFGGSFCTSMEQYEFLKNQKSVGKYHEYIPLGIREDIVTKSIHNSNSKIKIGFIARSYYDGVKGEYRLFNIATKLDPSKFEFIILSPNLDSLVSKIRGLGFNVFTKNHTNFMSLYSMIDVTLILSKYEGTPLPLIESMKFGHTVLSTKVGEAPLLLNDTPYILSTDDEFVRALNKINKDRNILKENIKINRKKVHDRTWSTFVNRSIKLWERLL